MFDKIVGKYREKTLRLDFKEIALTQLGLNNDQVYHGPGYIEQDEDGNLKYKLFYNSEIGLRILSQEFDLKRGELIPEGYYYSFEGVDIKGRKWTSERVKIDYHSSPNFSVINGELKKIKVARTVDFEGRNSTKGTYHTLWIPHKIDIPANSVSEFKHVVAENEIKSGLSRSAAEYETGDYKILLFEDEDWLIIQIHTKSDDYHPFELERFLSAFQFILAEQIQWVLHYKNIGQNYELTFRPFPEYSKSKYSEPLQFNYSNADKIWNLFNTYLNHILQNENDRNDNITRVISKCISAGRGSFDAYSLSLTLAIEEILNNCFQELSAEKSVKTEDIELLRSNIKELEIEQSFEDRLHSYLGYIQKTDARDRLRHLINNTPIKKSDYDNWKALRNHFVHPKGSKLSTQKKADKTYSNLSLLHKLIFIKVGYEGSFNDYSKRNWPKEKFLKA